MDSGAFGFTREGTISGRTDPPSSHEPGLRVAGLGHHFGRRRVLDGISLAVQPGEVHCLVGPSGCGKTTTLRLIAGLETVMAGRIWISGRLVAEPGFSLPPERRRVGLMFQDFALFPHLNVAENVGFGLRHLDRRQREARVRELLEQVNMAAYARAYPHTLSGGEQQRVALARALAPKPELMLLDEAFSALDTALRTQVREETLAILKDAGTATLLVTHDAEEAIRAGDIIHAMQDGRIVQSGPASELYARPADPFVAGFFGPVNRFRGRVRRGAVEIPLGTVPADHLPEGSAVEVLVRPEGIRLRPDGEGRTARLVARRDLGPVHLVWLELADRTRVKVRETRALDLEIGSGVGVELDAGHVFLFPAE